MSEEQAGQVRHRRSSAEVERLVGEYEASGLSQAEFCRAHGLALSTLHRYCRRQQQAHAGASGRPAWVAVELPNPDRVPRTGGSGLAVVFSNGRRIEVARRFDSRTLVELLRVLERR